MSGRLAGKLPPCVPYDPATPDDLAETVNLVEATGHKIFASVVDTRDADGLRTAVDDGVAALGRSTSVAKPASRWRAHSPPNWAGTRSASTACTRERSTPSWEVAT